MKTSSSCQFPLNNITFHPLHLNGLITGSHLLPAQGVISHSSRTTYCLRMSGRSMLNVKWSMLSLSCAYWNTYVWIISHSMLLGTWKWNCLWRPWYSHSVYVPTPTKAYMLLRHSSCAILKTYIGDISCWILNTYLSLSDIDMFL